MMKKATEQTILIIDDGEDDLFFARETIAEAAPEAKRELMVFFRRFVIWTNSRGIASVLKEGLKRECKPRISFSFHSWEGG